MLIAAFLAKWAKWDALFSSLFVTGLAVLAATGCIRVFVGSVELVEAREQVFLDGDPVTGARIVFVPRQAGLGRNDRLSYGTTGSDGEFSLKLADNRTGAFPGLNRIFISKADFEQPGLEIVSNAEIAAGTLGMAHVNKDFSNQPSVAEINEQIPFYYNSQSELTSELIPGQSVQKIRFDLVSIDPLLK